MTKDIIDESKLPTELITRRTAPQGTTTISSYTDTSGNVLATFEQVSQLISATVWGKNGEPGGKTVKLCDVDKSKLAAAKELFGKYTWESWTVGGVNFSTAQLPRGILPKLCEKNIAASSL